MSEDEASKAGQAKPNHYEAVQRILSDSPRPFEALALLAFYSHVASWQRDYMDTGLIQATTGFCAAGLKVSETAIRKAKRELMALGLVEDLKLSGAKHEILAWRIALNFDPFNGSVKAILPGSPYAGFSQPLDTARTMSSKQDQIVKEDEEKQEQKQKPRESHPLVRHQLPEEAGRSPLPNSKMADGKMADGKIADGKSGLGGDSHPQPIEDASSRKFQTDEKGICSPAPNDFADDGGTSAAECQQGDNASAAKEDSKPGNVQGQEAEGLKEASALLSLDSSKEEFINWFEDFLSFGKDDPEHPFANAWLDYELLYRKYPKVRYDLFQKFLLLRKEYVPFERQFAMLVFLYKPSSHIQSLRNLADEAFKSGFVLQKPLMDVITCLPEFCEFKQLFTNDNWRSAMKLSPELVEMEAQLEPWLGKPAIWQLGQLADLLKELEASASSITEYREWNEDQKADNERFALSWALFLSKSRIQDFMRATEDTRRIRKETAEDRRQRQEAAKKIMAFGEGLPEIKQIADDILHCRCTVQAGIRKFNHKMETYGLGESAFI